MRLNLSRMVRALTAVVTLTLAFASPAAATAPDNISQEGVVMGIRVGQAMWGDLPCGTPYLDWRVPEYTSNPDGLAWWAGPCEIALNPGRQNDPVWQMPDYVCTIIAHEWGHMTGHPHDNTPGSVMNPALTVPRECRPPAKVATKPRWRWGQRWWFGRP